MPNRKNVSLINNKNIVFIIVRDRIAINSVNDFLFSTASSFIFNINYFDKQSRSNLNFTLLMSSPDLFTILSYL